MSPRTTPNWDDLPTVMVPISKLVHDPENARVHPTRNREAIRAALAEFGQQEPIVIAKDGKTVIAGNGQLDEAIELGWDEIWATKFPGTPKQARAYGFIDNRSSDLSEFDPAKLLAALRQISADNLLDAVAFRENEIQDLLASMKPPQMGGPPPEFPAYDEDLETDHECPECGYEWSGGQ